jgi:hypothetical protein
MCRFTVGKAFKNPADFIRMRFSDEIIKELLKIKWWNFPKYKIKRIIPLLTQPKVDIELIRELSKH